MATDTGVKIEGSKVEVEGKLDMNLCEDLPPATVDGCGGGGDCNGDGKNNYISVNDSDATLDDYGKLDGNEEPNASESNVDSLVKVEGGDAKFTEGDRLETCNGDARLYPGEKDGDGELKVDSHVEVEGADANVTEGDQLESCNGDAGLYPGEQDGDNVDSHVKAEGGDAKVTAGDRLETCNGDARLYPGEKDGDGELNVVSREKVEGGDAVINGDVRLDPGDRHLNVDYHEKVEGDDVVVNQLEIHNGESHKLKNDIKIDGGELKFENEVNAEIENDGKIEVGELVMENGVINSQSEAIVEAGQLVVENGGSHNLDGNVHVKIRNSEIVEENDTKPIANGFKDRESSIQKWDNCNPSVDGTGTPILDVDDKVRIALAVDGGSDSEPADNYEGQNEIAGMEATPLVPDGDSEEQQHFVEPQRYEDKGNKLETPKIEAGKFQVVEDIVHSHVDDIPVREMEPLDSNIKESKPSEADVGHQLLEGRVPTVHSPLGGEAKESLTDVPVTVNQSLVCQKEVISANEESKELGLIEAEDKVKEQSNFDQPEVARNQELSSVHLEHVRYELPQSEEGDTKCLNATNLTTESEGFQESHTVPVPSEEAENQSGLESTALGVERLAFNRLGHADVSNVESTAEVDNNTTSPAVGCETNGKGKLELIAVLVGGQESSVKEDILQDQMPKQTESVNVMDKEIPVEDHGLRKTRAVEEATNLSKTQDADVATVVEDVDDRGRVGASDNKVSDNHDNQTVPRLGQASEDEGGCLRAEDGDLGILADSAAHLHVQSDWGTIEEQGVVNNASYVADSSRSDSSNDTSPLPEVECSNSSLPYSAHDAQLQIRAMNGGIGVLNKSKCISDNILKPKISFGSFECEAPFSYNDVKIQRGVCNRSTEFTSSESKVKPSDGVALLNSDANEVHFTGSSHDKTCDEDLHVDHINKDEVSASPLQGSGADTLKGQNLSMEVVEKPSYYLITIPKCDDTKIREQIRLSEIEVDEKTRSRDSVRVEYQKKKAAVYEHKSRLVAAKSEERVARGLVIAKRQEIDAAQSLINLAKNAMTVEDVQGRIAKMEHKIQHETLNLNEEKQLVREIKQMRNLKGQLSADTRSQERLQQALDQKVQVEEHLKVLRKEMDSLRDNLSKAEESVKVTRKKYDEESFLLNELYLQFTSADTVQQKAYEDLVTLRKQRYEKNKYFRKYKDDAKVANEYAKAGEKDRLECHCVDQVDKIMELWNKSDEFRQNYIRSCNARSKSRRFRTRDDLSLGLDEEPPSLGNVSDNRVTSSAKVNSVEKASTMKGDTPIEAKIAKENSSKKVIEQKNKTALAKKMAEATSKNSLAETTGKTEIEEEKEEVKLTKEEMELARKAEQLRRDEDASRLREQRKLEEKAKAKEALERKRRMAEKAQARAEFRAQKEAEQKEKEKEKRAKKKEKKRGLTSDTAESEPALAPESSSETITEPDVTEKPVIVAKKPSNRSLYIKQIKTTKSVPPPIRSRGKKRIKQWMCFLLAVMLALALFYLGDSNFYRNWNFSFGSGFWHHY